MNTGCARGQARPRPSRGAQAGFTLLEVLVALAILTVSMLVLIDVQSTAANMTVEAEKMMVATMLSEDKLVEVRLGLEDKGFSTQDVEEDGDFKEAYAGEFDDYRWEYSVLTMNVTGATAGLGSLISAADETEEDQSGSEVVGGTEDQMEQGMGLLGMSPEFLSEEMGRFVRELKVRVYWPVGGGEDYVELVTHIINPSGKTVDPDADEGEDLEQLGEITQ